MAGEMKRNQIMQTLFGYQSEEDESENDGGLKPENERKSKSEGGSKGVHHQNDLKSLRLSYKEKSKDREVLSTSAIHDVFGDSDDDKPVDNTIDNQINEENVCPKGKGKCSKESVAENVVHEEDASPVVIEIPLRRPLANEDQMAIIKLSNIIGIDPKPFDPDTFVDEDYYVTDETGSKRLIPSTNIIRWRYVENPDGTTEVQSNARFVTWMDGSVQLLIGNEAFDVTEQAARDIQTHLFIKHDNGIYESQGRISRTMKFTPSSLSSDTHRHLTALIDSRNKKVNKVKHFETDVDPERIMEQIEKAERQTAKANEKLNKKKKKVRDKYRRKGHKDHQLTPSFLEDAISEDNEQKNDRLDLDLEKEALAEKRIMNAKKGPKDPHKSTSSSRNLQISDDEKVEENEVEASMSYVEDSENEDEVSDNFSS